MTVKKFSAESIACSALLDRFDKSMVETSDGCSVYYSLMIKHE